MCHDDALVVTNSASPTAEPGVRALLDGGADIGEDAAASAARLFKALGDPVRVQLLSLVAQSAGGEVCFRDLAAEFDMPQPSLSHHLKILVNAGMLERERKGTWSCYRVVEECLAALETLLRPGGPFRTSSACVDPPVDPEQSLAASA
jgi:DNA-binding transcriptional ArsR family regulator